MDIPANDLYFAVMMFDAGSNYLSVGLYDDFFVVFEDGITITSTSGTKSTISTTSSTISSTSPNMSSSTTI